MSFDLVPTIMVVFSILWLVIESVVLRQKLRAQHDAERAACDLEIDRLNGVSETLRAAHERIAELEDDLHEREDQAALVITMGRELRADAEGETGQSDVVRRCALYYLMRYREVFAEESEEPANEAIESEEKSA